MRELLPGCLHRVFALFDIPRAFPLSQLCVALQYRGHQDSNSRLKSLSDMNQRLFVLLLQVSRGRVFEGCHLRADEATPPSTLFFGPSAGISSVLDHLSQTCEGFRAPRLALGLLAVTLFPSVSVPSSQS